MIPRSAVADVLCAHTQRKQCKMIVLRATSVLHSAILDLSLLFSVHGYYMIVFQSAKICCASINDVLSTLVARSSVLLHLFLRVLAHSTSVTSNRGIALFHFTLCIKPCSFKLILAIHYSQPSLTRRPTCIVVETGTVWMKTLFSIYNLQSCRWCVRSAREHVCWR